MKNRLLNEMNELGISERGLSLLILNNQGSCIPWIEEELRETEIAVHLEFSDSLSIISPAIRTNDSTFIGKMIWIEGFVTSDSFVSPKLRKSAHRCDVDDQFHPKDYRDSTVASSLPPTNIIYPLKDQNGHLLNNEFGLGECVDFQTIKIQDMPENSPP